MKVLPVLRADLIFQEQKIKHVVSFICKDPIKQSYYRFDEEEHFVLAKLDNSHTASEIAEEYNAKFNDELSDKDIEEFVSSLSSKNLFERSTTEQNTYLYERLKEQRKSKILQTKGSWMYFRIKVWDPNSFFDRIIPFIRWIWSPQFVLAMNIFMICGFIALLFNLSDVKSGIAHIFDFGNKDMLSLFLLWATVMGTIMVHELGHGLTCKRFGGECHEIGFLFMFLNPCMYANVNDAWMFENKRHRLYVTFAGCYIEMVLGFICVYIWLFTQAGSTINLIAFQIVVVAFFSAIFMNFNPLMKFDGYFALSDYVEVPNLRNRSQGYLKYLIQRYVFRLDRECEEFLTRREQWIFFIYGGLVVIYLINVFSGLGIMFGSILMKKFDPRIGLILTIFLMYKILGTYAKKLFGFIKTYFREHSAFFKKKPIRTLGIILGTIILLFIAFVPLAQYLEFNAILEPENTMIVRSKAVGYVKSFLMPNQLAFNKGDTLLTIKNYDLDQQVKNTSIEIKQNELTTQQMLLEDDQVQMIKLKKIHEKLLHAKTELVRQIHNLVILAPFNGVLVEPLSSLENTAVKQGQELGTFIDPSRFKATIDILEREMESISQGNQATLVFAAQPENIYQGSVTDIAVMPEIEGIARTYQVTVSFPNKNMLFRQGLNGVVSLKIRKATMLQSFIRWIQKTIRLDLQF